MRESIGFYKKNILTDTILITFINFSKGKTSIIHYDARFIREFGDGKVPLVDDIAGIFFGPVL